MPVEVEVESELRPVDSELAVVDVEVERELRLVETDDTPDCAVLIPVDVDVDSEVTPD
jgi:hypothetical protein